MRRFLTYLFALAVCFTTTFAAAIDEARALYRDGNYQQVVDLLEPLRKKSPRDGNIAFYLGAALYQLGRFDEAMTPLEVAENKKIADASRMLAAMAINRYDVDAADSHLDTWEEILSRKRNADTGAIEAMRSRIVTLRNMLERVEAVEIIDSINVDEADFFTRYRLSPEAGRLLTPAEADVDAATVVYIPQNNSEMIWARRDSSETLRLTSAAILDDGTIDRPTDLKGDFSAGGDADFPFMMPDGMTLYFAATGDNSIGGYDIFMTRRSDDGFLQPQNVGMPYNSMSNDYMMAIDETTGAGWFASDRAGIPGKVTIYTFIPSQTRVNYESDDPDLASYALITSIARTQKGEEDYSAVRSRIDALDNMRSVTRRSVIPSFALSMGNGKVYTSLDDFSDPQARKEMAALLQLEDNLRQLADKLADLRYRYGRGDHSVADEILDNEASYEFLQDTIAEQRDKVIRLETE